MTPIPPAPDDIDRFPERPSTWPTTFGVLALVFGMFGFLSSSWNVASGLLMPRFLKWTSSLDPGSGGSPAAGGAGENPLTAIMAGMEDWLALSALCHALLLAAAILLIAGGVLLLRRKPAAPRFLTIWAYAKIVLGIGAGLIGFLMGRSRLSAQMELGSTPMDSWVTIIQGIGFIVGVLWTCALPVLFLIWLNREVVKADIGTWPAGEPSLP